MKIVLVVPRFGIASLYFCTDILKNKLMTIQEIYDSWPLRRLEHSILDLQRKKDKGLWGRETGVVAIRELLEHRKNLLDGMFVMDAHYKQLLYDFNEAIKEQMIEVRKRTINLYEAISKARIPGTIEVKGKCYLGFNYPKLHPIQDNRAHKMWDILNGCDDNYMPLYDDGLGQFEIYSYNMTDTGYDSVNQTLYLGEEPYNCNDGLNREMTEDMMLTFQFHDLYDHMEFSIFDLLWVRDFELELDVEMDDFHEFEDVDDE